MTAALTGLIGGAGGLMGMIGGMRGAKSVASGGGLSALMYQIAGQEQQGAYRDEAAMLGRQAGLAYEQSLVEAAQLERQTKAFREEQALRFASSGITLAGSPLGVLEETRALGAQSADAIRTRGREVSNLYEMQGLQMLRQGSAAAFAGVAQGLTSKYNAQMQAWQLSQGAAQAGFAGAGALVQGGGALFGKGGPFRGGGGFGAAPAYAPQMVP